jgi:regulator of nonsense transcripts 2
MVKFKMFLKSEALFCLKMLIFDFAHHQIEMSCTIMETCGRYMYRTKESHQRTKIYLVR